MKRERDEAAKGCGWENGGNCLNEIWSMAGQKDCEVWRIGRALGLCGMISGRPEKARK